MLRTHKLGEADRIVVLMTAGRGKVRSVAKGARKPGSRFAARLEPPALVSVQLHRGRDLDTVTQADTADYFGQVRQDMRRLSDAMALVEAVDCIAMEGEAYPPLFEMLTGALRTLARADHRPPLLVAAFYLKLLTLEGVGPVVDRCARCGAAGELVSFDFAEGGALCLEHRRGPAIEPASLALARRILGGQLSSALAEPAGRATEEVSAMAVSALESHLERRLRAVHLMA